MNDKNRALLFDEDSEEEITITITDENGNDIDAEVIAAIEIEELDKEFVAVLPLQEAEGLIENEALLLEYSEDEDGEPVFAPIEDEEMFELASQAFNQFFEEADSDDDADDDDDYASEDDYLEDIGNIVPGVSIKK